MQKQECNQCGEIKALNLFSRVTSRNPKTGVMYYPTGYGRTCKSCTNNLAQARRDEDRDALNAKRRDDYRENADTERARSREAYAANKDKKQAQRKANREADPEKYRAYTRKSMAANPEIRERDRANKSLKRAMESAKKAQGKVLAAAKKVKQLSPEAK